MPDLRDRFRSLDQLPAPDLWAEVADRAEAPQKTNWPFALGALAAIVLVAVVIGLQLRSGALVGGPGPSETAAPPASVEASPSAEPSPSVQPSVEPSPSDELPAFVCGQTFTSAATANSIVNLADVRVGTHSGYDRIVFEYAGDYVPGVEVRLAEEPFTRDPSGLPMPVNGSPVYLIVITGGTKVDANGSPTYTGPTDFQPGYEQIYQLTERGDFEAVNSWYLGVNGGTCLRVFHLTDPSRIVIDVQH